MCVLNLEYFLVWIEAVETGVVSCNRVRLITHSQKRTFRITFRNGDGKGGAVWEQKLLSVTLTVEPT